MAVPQHANAQAAELLALDGTKLERTRGRPPDRDRVQSRFFEPSFLSTCFSIGSRGSRSGDRGGRSPSSCGCADQVLQDLVRTWRCGCCRSRRRTVVQDERGRPAHAARIAASSPSLPRPRAARLPPGQIPAWGSRSSAGESRLVVARTAMFEGRKIAGSLSATLPSDATTAAAVVWRA